MKGKVMKSPQIPSDLFIEILVFLPVNALLRFKSVCKEWYILINTRLFVQLHLQKSLESDSLRNRGLLLDRGGPLDIVDDVYHPSKITTLDWPEGIIGEYESASSVGVCNGLACFRVKLNRVGDFGEADFFLICNPLLRTFKITPPPIKNEWSGPDSMYLNGFGYDSEHDDYKIVVTLDTVDDESVRDVQIYSLKADSWKCLTPTPSPSSLVSSENIDDPVYVNNMIHYKIYAAGSERIGRFDLSLERWMDDLLLPAQVQYLEFGAMDGCMYQCASSNDDVFRSKEGSTDVWIMEKVGAKESESSWSKMFHLPGLCFRYTLIAHAKEGSSRLLLLQPYGAYSSYGGNFDKLYWYDQQENTSVPFLPEIKIMKDEASVELYFGSLVSIPGCSVTKMKQVLRSRNRLDICDSNNCGG